MPPLPSLKKRAGGRSQKRKPKPIDEEKEKELADAFAATSLGRDLGLTKEEFAADAVRVPLNERDKPTCDGCSTAYAGTMKCAQCESVFYCCRGCQVAHWTSKHKGECSLLKVRNEDTAKRVLKSFETLQGWTDLDLSSTYKAAVRLGLHDKIREVFERDITSIIGTCRNEKGFLCYVHPVMKVLFEQRAEGKTESASGNADGLRIKGYVRSHPDAFDTWLRASVRLIHAILDRTTLMQNPSNHSAVHHSALEVWKRWVIVFTSPAASRAVLTAFPPNEDGTSKSAGGEVETEAAVTALRKMSEDRARRIVETLRDVMRLLNSVWDPRLDPDNKVGGTVCFLAAVVHHRLRHLRIGIDAKAIYDLEGRSKRVYEFIAPIAKRYVEKSSVLNSQEASAAMARVCGLGRR
jgi:MYND finger